jgi:hypothetical protein
LNYAQQLESPTSAERLNAALEQAGALEVAGAVAGGRTLSNRIASSRLKDQHVQEAWKLYGKMMKRDIWLSSVSSIAYIGMIAVLIGLVALIVYQLVNRQFSYRQLAGVPLPLLIRLLFRANTHERDNYRKMRADLTKALRFATELPIKK